MTDNPTAAGPDSRRLLRPLLIIGLLGFAVHVLLPQTAELAAGVKALRTGRWPFLGIAAAGSGLALTASAWMVRASVPRPPPWVRTIAIQVAGVFSSAVTPAGVGSVALNAAYLHAEGLDDSTARAATGVNAVLTVASHIGLLLVLLPALPSVPSVRLPPTQIVVDAVAVFAVVAGIVLWLPASRRRVLATVVPIFDAVPRIVSTPRRSTLMVAAAVATNLFYGVSLAGAVAAFGATAPFVGLLVVYLVAASVSAVSPTPGGLGAMETALVAGMTRVGVHAGAAVAATLAFRLATFWLPLALGAGLLARARRLRWL